MTININKKDVIWSYLSLIIFNGINIILLPFILAYLSKAEIGLWYTFTAVAGLVVIMDFGFQSTLSRNVTFVWEGAREITVTGFKESKSKSPNYNLFVNLFKVTKIIYLFIGLIILFILFTLGTWYVYSVSKNDLSMYTIFISWGLYATAVFLNMKYAYWNAILKGIGAIKLHQQILIITKMIQLILSIIGIILGYGLIAVSLAYLISIIVNRILAYIKFFSYQNNRENIKPLIKNQINKKEVTAILKKILPNTYRQGLISISNYINLQSTTLLSSAYLGLNVTASLGLVLQIINLITTVANTFFNTYLSQFSSYRFKKQYKELKLKFKQALLVNYGITILSFIAVFFLGDIILIFLNSNVSLLDSKYLLIIMVYMFLYNNQSVFGTFIATDNKLPHYKAFFISSLLVIGTQLLLINIFEPTLWSLLVPIMVIQMVYNNWKWPVEVFKSFKSLKKMTENVGCDLGR
ncbi:O-unit flippase-like protein [Bacillus norwichensis]|uniref:Polysaccharide biosynthesis protein n=1 Tax=Bacillus norwichensis TaxID=2762217 RepID=A0ABR8VHL3_9BACI|nr:O-unit flippase-like protein [Bacillus norwichensis]MBD8004258.1 hypothetical protein [Bacillus norwichensis]